MKKPCLLQGRVLAHVLKAVTSRFTTRFPVGEYEPIERFRGRPRYDEDECIGCGACANVCPAKCIDVVDEVDGEKPVRVLVQHVEKCIWCGQCERYCTTQKGIRMTTEYDCAAFSLEGLEETCRKELCLCESCGAVIAPVDQLRWVASRLGHLAFANASLMLLVHKLQLRVLDERPSVPEDAPSRSKFLSIQCPVCRRKAVLEV